MCITEKLKKLNGDFPAKDEPDAITQFIDCMIEHVQANANKMEDNHE